MLYITKIEQNRSQLNIVNHSKKNVIPITHNNNETERTANSFLNQSENYKPLQFSEKRMFFSW